MALMEKQTSRLLVVLAIFINRIRSLASIKMNQQAVRLFHPRQDDWEEHFRVEIETGRVEGRTEIGRATIACLCMNEPLQLAARRQWIHLGFYE